LGGEALSAHLRRVIEADPNVRFVVVVPVAAPVLDVGGAMGAMSGMAMIDATVQDRLSDAARDRLRVVLEWLRGAGVEAEGTVVGDPMVAMQAAVAAQTFDEIVISTLPARVSGWLRQDLAHRAVRRFSVPVTTITAADDTLPPATARVITSSTTTTAPRERVLMAESVYHHVIDNYDCTERASSHGRKRVQDR
jgi:GABA permease